MEQQEHGWNLDLSMEVRKILKIKGMTQEQLADEINCSRIYLNEVLNLKRNNPFVEEALERWINENK